MDSRIKKIAKYVITGGFLFFFIKGLLWLAVFVMAWFGYINFF